MIKSLGSPRDYSSNVFETYFEFYSRTNDIKSIINKYCTIVKEVDLGYITHCEMQKIPEIIRDLAQNNHAVYQVVRIAKIK